MRTLALLMAACSALCAQDKPQRGRQVLNDALEALGGAQFLSVRDRVETGRVYSFYREQLSGLSRAVIYTRYLTAPDQPEPGKVYLRERQSFGKPKEEEYAILFSEEKGWQITFRGARPLPADSLARYLDAAPKNIFYILRYRLKEKDLLVESQGSSVLDNQPVDVVDITDAANNVITVFFHKSTRLPIRQVSYRRDPNTRIRHEEITLFGKYRDIGGGVQWPLQSQRHRDGSKIFEIFADTVELNKDLDESLFSLPVKMKILPPAR